MPSRYFLYYIIKSHDLWLISLRATITPYQPHSHNLRNANNDDIISVNSTSYRNSFLHATIREWNALSPAERDLSVSVETFKSKLNRKRKKPPDYYFIGKRKYQIIHANMRTQSTDLNYHLFERYLREDTACDCGAPVEDPNHYFRICPLYKALRHEIFGMHIPSLETLLYGAYNRSNAYNISVFTKVEEFIIRSERF